MNTKRRYIYLKICTLLMFVCLTACNRDPHEEERGMAVTIDNTQCPDVPIGAIKLYIYGTGETSTPPTTMRTHEALLPSCIP
ncbi:hypothetical protein KUBF_26080 [Bacteroides finegoldii]|nr:hypothetical protein KUBF_26080 [Bacteroides finegoldii]